MLEILRSYNTGADYPTCAAAAAYFQAQKTGVRDAIPWRSENRRCVPYLSGRLVFSGCTAADAGHGKTTEAVEAVMERYR